MTISTTTFEAWSSTTLCARCRICVCVAEFSKKLKGFFPVLHTNMASAGELLL
jgi:hypothetical protein